MATSLLQKVRLWWRGTQRRREEQQRDFVAANAAWGRSAAPETAPQSAAQKRADIDRAGLQAAFLDQSGVIAYYLDTETGEVLESRGIDLAPPRYQRVPTQSDDEDRRTFLETLDAPIRARIASSTSFRAAIAEDRSLERAWYNFKNNRATAAIEKWLSGL